MGITHVIRAEEWIPSTPKHLRLYDAFGWETPEFIHMPLLRNLDKSKISKRKNPTSIDYYQRIGILPEVMRNFLALMGYSLGEDREKFTLEELIEAFDIDRVSLGEPVFDLEKLNWLNGIYIREMAPEDLFGRIMEHQFSASFLQDIIPLIQERIRRLDEFIPKTSFFFASELEYDDQLLIGKKMTAADMVPIFEGLADEFDALRTWNSDSIETILREYGEKNELKARAYFMPVRIAITGRKASPGLFETMEVIGKPLCQARMREAVLRLKVLKKNS
jgi:glutamyl-tRNA synthetase